MNDVSFEKRDPRSRASARHIVWPLIAMFPLIIFAVLHLLGWRDDTAIISGTFVSDASTVRGLLYGMSYFAAAVVSPILLIATAMSLVTRRACRA